MSILDQLIQSKDKYIFVENLEPQLMDLPPNDQIKEIIPEWNGAGVVEHGVYKFIRVDQDADLDYSLFHYTKELSDYFGFE